MKSLLFATVAGVFAPFLLNAAEIGKSAPEFKAKDLKGVAVSSSDLRGKVVVLEWLNFSCPFVVKHYSTKNMQELQATYTGKDVVWITVNSSAKGNDGYHEDSEMAKLAAENGSKASHFVVDADGTIGKAFGAKVTPHMIIIDKEGMLKYDGAIDSKATTESADVATADKLFATALNSVLAGKEVANAKNQPYGCGVKY